MELILVPMAVVKTDWSDWRLETKAYAHCPVERIIIFVPGNLALVQTPGTAHIGEEYALYLLRNGEAVFQSAGVHFLAFELVVFIAAERIGTAQAEEVAVGNVAVDIACHQAESQDMAAAQVLRK